MFSQFLRLSPHFAPALQLKRMLSANAEAPLNIECIMEDADVRGKLTREELEVICAPLFDRFKAPIEKVGGAVLAGEECRGGGTACPCHTVHTYSLTISTLQALADAGMRPEDISSVEIVGSSTRMPGIAKIIEDVLGRVPSRTMNSKECVSRGCALQCAMLSPVFKVRMWGRGYDPLTSVPTYNTCQ